MRPRNVPFGLFSVQFNVTVQDDKQVNGQLKQSLEGRLPQQDCPVCVEISMETLEVSGWVGESEGWAWHVQ